MLSKKSKLSEPSPPIYIEDKIYQLVFTGTNSCEGCVFYENNREKCIELSEKDLALCKPRHIFVEVKNKDGLILIDVI
jgi:hypothetical protein